MKVNIRYHPGLSKIPEQVLGELPVQLTVDVELKPRVQWGTSVRVGSPQVGHLLLNGWDLHPSWSGKFNLRELIQILGAIQASPLCRTWKHSHHVLYSVLAA